jgi:hypothetical protein
MKDSTGGEEVRDGRGALIKLGLKDKKSVG